MDKFTYIPGVVNLLLDAKTCIGCSLCITVCPHQVFDLRQKKAVIIRRDACMECGACSQNCPTEAISITPGVGCAALILSRWLAKVGIKSKGCC